MPEDDEWEYGEKWLVPLRGGGSSLSSKQTVAVILEVTPSQSTSTSGPPGVRDHSLRLSFAWDSHGHQHVEVMEVSVANVMLAARDADIALENGWHDPLIRKLMQDIYAEKEYDAGGQGSEPRLVFNLPAGKHGNIIARSKPEQ